MTLRCNRVSPKRALALMQKRQSSQMFTLDHRGRCLSKQARRPTSPSSWMYIERNPLTTAQHFRMAGDINEPDESDGWRGVRIVAESPRERIVPCCEIQIPNHLPSN